MKRIMVIGCCGAGKSTFSRKLHAISNIDLYPLDKYYWKPNWVETEAEEWDGIVKELSEQEEWIIDGNYARTMDIRLKRADTVIFLDCSTLKCLWRITKRTLQYYRKKRPDMASNCKEKFDADFYLYVATFNFKKRKKLINKIQKFQSVKSIYIFKNDFEINQFLDEVEKSM